MDATIIASLKSKALELRRIAEPVGPLHSYWDIIFDIEALLRGDRTLLQKTPEEWIAYADKQLASRL